ncbi:MAG: hypothetical protein E6R06_24360 [Mycobacterium sp.]|nr:MAG: hypothetical protein E6R06_24360 [Mycobacterium sp.]
MRRTVGVAALLAAAFGMGLAGGLLGTHINPPPAPPAPAAAAEPSAAEVRAQTIDLCTRFAAAYAAIPAPQTTSADMIPATNYVSDALRDNANADSGVREAVGESLRLMRQQSAALSHEKFRGAVQPPRSFEGAPANRADDRVWDACYQYGE